MATMAGNTVNVATAHSRMPPPAMIPISATPVNFVNPEAKKAIEVVMAPVAIAGPTAEAA